MASVPASHVDLLDARVAVLATVGPDGRPQLSAVWFLAADGQVSLSLNATRQKVKNLRHRPGCTLFVYDPADTRRYLEVRGDADIVADPDYRFADRVGVRYGADLRVHDAPGESRVVVTLRPVKVNTIDLSA